MINTLHESLTMYCFCLVEIVRFLEVAMTHNHVSHVSKRVHIYLFIHFESPFSKLFFLHDAGKLFPHLFEHRGTQQRVGIVIY